MATKIALKVKENGNVWDAEFWAAGGFVCSIPDGENRDWAELKARELFERPSIWSIEDTEWLRSVSVASKNELAAIKYIEI